MNTNDYNYGQTVRFMHDTVSRTSINTRPDLPCFFSICRATQRPKQMDSNDHLHMVHCQCRAMRHENQGPLLHHQVHPRPADGRFHPRYRPLVDVLLQVE